MTSDAKIGLLLGLVFIFLIAFVINGLPSLRRDGNSNELTTDMVNSQNNLPGLGGKARREVIKRIEPIRKQPLKVAKPSPEGQDIRFETQLPKSPAVVTEEKPAALREPLVVAKKQESTEVRRRTQLKAKVYVISEGDNLAVISQKLYGSEDGNKRANINRIFEVNRKVLKSPDEIYPGQEIIIPPLSSSGLDESKPENILSGAMFAKVESIGRRYLSTDGGQAKKGKQYVVRDGDSLWRIAAEQLGDGNRYIDIAKLNADILNDQDSLDVGMRLKLPAK